MQLSELNDDCLDHLFKFLTIKDVVLLNFVFHCFREKAKRWITKNEIDFGGLAKCFYYTKPRDFFTIYGSLIKRISIQTLADHTEHLNLLPEYCKNVEYMRIVVKADAIDGLPFIGRMQSLRHLHLQGDVDQSVVDEIIKLQDLEILEIYDAPLSGYRLNEFRKLKELVLCRCENVTTERFFKAFLVNPNLRRINIHGCRYMYYYSYQCMAENLKKLESLEFDADLKVLDEKFTSIRGFHQLKHMTVHNVNDPKFGEVILDQYSKDMGETLLTLSCLQWREFSFPKGLLFPKLAELKVHCSSEQGVDDALRRLGESCPRLEKLTIRVDRRDSDGVTQDAVLDFFRQSKSVVLADLPIWDCFTVSFYKEISRIRKAFREVGRLKLLVGAEPQSSKFNEIKLFVKGNEYATLRKFVELELPD